jgi:hypothetical protein
MRGSRLRASVKSRLRLIRHNIVDRIENQRQVALLEQYYHSQ